MADAIGRTLWRLGVSRRHLLEWTPAAQAAIGPRLDLTGYARRMAGAIAIGGIAAIVALASGHGAWPVALPFAALWLASPAVARFVSLPAAAASRAPLTGDDAQALRRTARRTWRFFETFVTAADNMLPPDNFQEDPAPAVAHRTSPTNIGLYLLSVVCARDFGWIGTDQAIDRLEATLATMSRMQRLRGHLFNWYDTRDLRPLEPRYVSTVDSGNLAGHLIALANACREWGDRPFEASRRLQRRGRRARHDACGMRSPARRPADPDRNPASARRRVGCRLFGIATGLVIRGGLSDAARGPSLRRRQHDRHRRSARDRAGRRTERRHGAMGASRLEHNRGPPP